MANMPYRKIILLYLAIRKEKDIWQIKSSNSSLAAKNPSFSPKSKKIFKATKRSCMTGFKSK